MYIPDERYIASYVSRLCSSSRRERSGELTIQMWMGSVVHRSVACRVRLLNETQLLISIITYCVSWSCSALKKMKRTYRKHMGQFRE